MFLVQKRDAKPRGFTMIELLVVIAIIGILSTIVIASLSGARQRGRDGRRLSDVKQIQLALALYYDANKVFPALLSNLSGLGYIPTVPVDPLSGNDYAYVPLQGFGLSLANCLSYHLGATLERYNADTFGEDFDGVPSSSGYGTGSNDGPVCTDGISTPPDDFDGTNDPLYLIYDVRP